MSEFKLKWDEDSMRTYETGVDRGVVYPHTGVASAPYTSGEAWNGLISVTKSPSGAEATPLYANNKKYANLISAEEFAGSIEAYTYPDGFGKCLGKVEVIKGVRIGQQAHTPFGMCYRTLIGNDTEGTDHGYKLTLVYGATAAPSEETDTTINDSPEAKTLSWEFSTTPVEMGITVDDKALKPSATIEIDSRDFEAEGDAARLAALEAILYGSGDADARLPLPKEVFTTLGWTDPDAD